MRINEHLRVAAIIRNRTGELLVVRHEPSPDNVFWTAPGGLLHVGESLSYALRRSLTVDMGLQIRIGALACVGEVTIAKTNRRRIEHYFYAEADSPDWHSGGAVEWKTPEELRTCFRPVRVLEAVLRDARGEYLANVTDDGHAKPAPWTGPRRVFR